jgi:hypothetical protein
MDRGGILPDEYCRLGVDRCFPKCPRTLPQTYRNFPKYESWLVTGSVSGVASAGICDGLLRQIPNCPRGNEPCFHQPGVSEQNADGTNRGFPKHSRVDEDSGLERAAAEPEDVPAG